MNGKQRRLRKERNIESLKLMQEATRNKYNGVICLTRSRRGELVNICRSKGGGAEPYNDIAAIDLLSNGYVLRHKNLSGYFIATNKGYAAYEILMKELNT